MEWNQRNQIKNYILNNPSTKSNRTAKHLSQPKNNEKDFNDH